MYTVGSSWQVLRALAAVTELLAEFVSLLVRAGQHILRDAETPVLCKGALKAGLCEAPSQTYPSEMLRHP